MTTPHTIFDNTRTFLGLLDLEGILLEANQPYLKVIGADSDLILGIPIWESPWWCDSAVSIGKFREAIRRGAYGEPSRFELEHTNDDGNTITTELALSPVIDNKHVVKSIITEGRDITALKKTQRALFQSEQRFRSLVDLSIDWYWQQDKHYRFTHLSGNVEKLAGTPEDSHIGQCRWDFPVPDTEEMDWSSHHALLERHESFRNFEYKRINDAGEVVWLSTSGDPIFDAEKTFQGYHGTSHNITKQKHSESTSKENKLRLRLAVDIAGIGIWEWNMSSDHIIWDSKQFELFGVQKVEGPIPLSTVIDAIHPDDRERVIMATQNILEDGVAFLEEFRVIHPDGSIRWLLGCSEYLQNNEAGSTTHLVGVNIDITRSKKTEMALRESQSQLHIANQTLESRIAERTAQLESEAEKHKVTQSKLAITRRLDAIGQLSGGIAHDFNNLLSVITGNLELLSMELRDINLQEFINEADNAAKMGARLTGRLLRFARQSTLEPIVVDINKQVLDALEILRSTIGENISLSSRLHSHLWTTLVDPSEVENTVINLVINARDAMLDGGRITIETSNVHIAEEDVDGDFEVTPGDYVQLSVQDNGTGMSNVVKSRIFEPFFTTKGPGKGTGLGLAGIYGFAKQSGGYVNVDSEVNKGTTIQVCLPRHTQPATIDTQPGKPINIVLQNTKIRVLVVEDNDMVRKVTLKRLQALGYEVLQAENGPAAVHLLECETNIALVLSDVVMDGGMSGYDVARWVQINRPACNVLLTSGFIKQTADKTEVDLESLRVLHKPYCLAELQQAVVTALQQAPAVYIEQ